MANALEDYHKCHAFVNGATKATPASRERSMADLERALAEFDGLFAGFKYLDTTDCDMRPTPPHSPSPPSSPTPSTPSAAPTPPVAQSTASSQEHGHADNGKSAAARQHVADTANGFLFPLDVGNNDIATTEALDRAINTQLADSNTFGVSASPASSSGGGHDWTALRTLRAATEHYYGLFQSACDSLASPIVSELKDSYSSARDLRDRGLLVFRDVLQGQPPTELSGVFAFASLSYIISKLLHKRGKIAKDQILSGLMVWRQAIPSPEAKAAFDELARKLWPESSEYLHFIPLPDLDHTRLFQTHDSSSSQLGGLLHPATPSPPAHAVSQPHDLPTLQDPMSAQCFTPESGAFHNAQHPSHHTFTSGSGYFPRQGIGEASPHVTAAVPDASFNFQAQPHSEWVASEPRPVHGPVHEWSMHNLQDYAFELTTHSAQEFHFHDFLQPHLPPPPIPDASLEEICPFRLRDTPVFKNVLEYILTLNEDVGKLLDLIRGRAKPATHVALGHGDRHRRSRFRRSVRSRLFDPLRRQHTLDRQLLAILAMAEAFVWLGYWDSVAKVQRYLTEVSWDLTPCLWADFVRCVTDQTTNVQMQDQAQSARSATSPGPESSASSTEAAVAPGQFHCRHPGCIKSYAHMSNRRRHERGHGIASALICPSPGCTYKTTRSDVLNGHIKRVHKGAKMLLTRAATHRGARRR